MLGRQAMARRHGAMPWRARPKAGVAPTRVGLRGVCFRATTDPGVTMQSLLISFVTVAIAEMGDKTQLLSLTLAAKYRRPWPICIGIFVATLVNHALAGGVGALLAHWISARAMQWAVAISFIAMAAWALIPDKADDDAADKGTGHGLVIATIIAFFLAEMGDKTQIATVALAAQYRPLWQVVAGTTLGMMAANAPVVWLGARFAQRIPLNAARIAAACLFLALGLWNVYGLLQVAGA
jgi:putative Ca2+/H+ antiporter (TMEM165/GDT1 family)